MKILVILSLLTPFYASADEIVISPGQSISVGESTVVTCKGDSEADDKIVCGVEKFGCCEHTPYILNLETREKKWIGRRTIHREDALAVVRQYVAANKCKRWK